jgi:hypothetical protein
MYYILCIIYYIFYLMDYIYFIFYIILYDVMLYYLLLYTYYVYLYIYGICPFGHGLLPLTKWEGLAPVATFFFYPWTR